MPANLYCEYSELISGEPYYGNETDVWSLGVVLYALLCGFLPFDDETTSELYRKIKKGVFAVPPWLSAKSLKLLKEMLQVNPQKRLKVNDMLKHEWMTTGYDEPLQWKSKFQRNNLNQTAVRLISEYYHWTVLESEQRILELKYNQLTAFYFLLCKMSEQKLKKFRNTWLPRTKLPNEKIVNNNLISHPGYQDIRNGHTPTRIPYNFQPSFDDTNGRERSHTLDSRIASNNDIDKFIEYEKPYSSHRRRSKTMDTLKNETIAANLSEAGLSGSKEYSGVSSDPLIVITEAKAQLSQTLSRNYVNSNRLDVNSRTVQLKCGDEATNLHVPKRLAASCINLDGKNDEHKSSNFKDEIQNLSNSLDTASCLKEEKRPRTRSMREFTQRLSGFFKQDNGPRRVKAIYHVENTSTLSADDVRRELDRVLSTLVTSNMLTSYSNPEKFLFKCKAGLEKKTVFELEICLIPFMDNVVGIRRKRLKGDAWQYKELVEYLLSIAKL